MRCGYRVVPALLGLCGVLACSKADPVPSRTLTADFGNLAGTWRFRTDPQDVGEREDWQKPDYADTGWRDLRVPGCWEEQGVTDPRPGQPPRPKNGMPWTDYDGVAWYRLHVVVPAAWAGRPLALLLGTVDDYDRTFVNGHLVGQTPEGTYQASQRPRRYRVLPSAVRPGSDNVIAVRVVDGGGPGGLTGPTLSLLPEEMLTMSVRLPQGDRPLAERFANPPADARILKIIHSWPDAPAEQDELIRSLAGQGFGGVVCNVSFNQYLESEERWQAFKRAVAEAKRAGMAMWLYDERGYPSGTAGGITLRGHPEWEAQGLLAVDAETGPGKVEIDVPPGELRLAAAFPVTADGMDLSRQVDLRPAVIAGKLVWSAPAGRWRVMAITQGRLFEGTHATMSLADHIPYVNLMEPDATRRFLEVTHDQYAARLGADLGKWFISTFTDEPSLMSMYLRPMPYRPLPWSQAFAGEFRKRRGYALEPLLPALVANAGAQGRKVRYDYWLTVAELTSDSFFGEIQAWCRAHHTQSGGHLLLEESLSGHVPLYGDFFRCVRRLDAPSIDCLTSVPAEVPWQIARLVSSAAEIEGRVDTMCETSDHVQHYRPAGDTRPVRVVTEGEIRGTCNRLLVGGINTITSYYTFTGLSSDQLRSLNAHVGRCATMLRGGHQVADVALVYPIESLWPRFRPSRVWASEAPDVTQVEGTYNAAAWALYGAARDVTFVDGRALMEAKVEGGALVNGRLRWRAVVLPRADTLPMAAWEKLAAFVRAGGVVIALGALPANSETEFPSARVAAIASEVFGQPAGPFVNANGAGGAGIYLPPGAESLLVDALSTALALDVRVSPAGSPIRSTHRRIDGHEVYFLINDSGQAWRGTVTVAAAGPGERWDPATGRRSALAGPAGISLDLGPYDAVLLRFDRPAEPERRSLTSGPLRSVVEQELQPVQPFVGKGEFVTGGVGAGPAAAVGGRGWRAKGTITKSQVDTFLFLAFDYPASAGLAGAECLVLDTWAPEGQQAPTQLLVILHEKGGGDYVAEVGRSLGVGGRTTCYVPISQFRPAGWSKDADGQLDLDEVTGIRVGWGGYLGTQGESIEFALGPIRAGRRPR